MVAGVWKWVPNQIVFTGVLGGRVGMERPNGAVDEKHLGIRRFMERINLGLVSLDCCDFNGLYGLPEMVQIITLVVITGTRVPFESISVIYFPTCRVGTAER